MLKEQLEHLGLEHLEILGRKFWGGTLRRVEI